MQSGARGLVRGCCWQRLRHFHARRCAGGKAGHGLQVARFAAALSLLRCWAGRAVDVGAAAALPLTPSVCRLALTRPDWSPSLNGMWPQRFKEAAQTLLLASACSRSCCEEASGCSSGSPRGGGLPLGRDTLLEVLQRAAYPISAWM